jgi:hypothetical protein
MSSRSLVLLLSLWLRPLPDEDDDDPLPIWLRERPPERLLPCCC